MSATAKSRALVTDLEGRGPDLECDCGGGWWFDEGEPSYAVHADGCGKANLSELELYALAALAAPA